MFMSELRESGGIRDYLRELNFITLILRVASFSLTTILAIDIMVASFFPTSLVFFMISFIGFLCLFVFNYFRSKGNVLFEVITEEVEWNFKNTEGEKSEQQSVEFRLSLKNFLKSSDLPFAPGNLGLIVYFIIFVGIVIFKAIKSSVIGQ